MHFWVKWRHFAWTVNAHAPASVCLCSCARPVCANEKVSPRTPCGAAASSPWLEDSNERGILGAVLIFIKTFTRVAHPKGGFKCFFTLVMSAQNNYLFWIIYSSARRNFLISPFFCFFCSAGDSKWLLVSRKPMDRRFHQSIRKHLPHTQHDLYLVNRIVWLYPYIIMALILLAVCLMLFLRLTSRSTEIEGGLVQYWPEHPALFLGIL